MHGTVNPGWSKAKHAARATHLDKDAAGRLLEGASNRTPREMTVTATLGVAVQNPAYRLITSGNNPFPNFPERVIVFPA